MYIGRLNFFLSIALVVLSTGPSISLANIGVICTLSSEYDSVRRLMDEPLTLTFAGRQFTTGSIGQRNVVVVVSPMGKVNNAVTAMLLLERYHVDRILSVGTAGSLTPSLPVGSVIYSSLAVYHDQGRVLVTGFTPYQRRFPEVALRKRKVEQIEFFTGLIASGDQFISNGDLAEKIRSMTGAHAVDTNSAAIGTVCKTFEIDCSFIRQITDASNADSAFRYQMEIDKKLSHLALVEYVLKGNGNAI